MKVKTIKTQVEAEQYLEDVTNWHSLYAIVGADMATEEVHSTGERYLIVTYDQRDYQLNFGDWVVQYPDGSMHFFDKAAFDELFSSPLAREVTDEEIEMLRGATL